MNLTYIFKTSLRGLRANKTRTALTILGIVIGISSIILVMSVGQGAQELILGQIRGMGSRTISVEPGKEPEGPSDMTEIFTNSIKDKDLEMLSNPGNVPGVKEIAPNVMRNFVIVSDLDSIRTTVIGTSELLANILETYPSEGVFFTDEDIKQKASSAVIGSEVKKKLFGESDALGQKIKIGDRNFRVVGILSPKGQVSILNVDDLVLVPYSTARQYLLGINYFNSIIIQAETEEMVPRVMEDIRMTLRESHGITDPSRDDFHVMSQADAAERVGTVTGVLSALLVSIAAISLVVGGIGIMNIMLVAVTERTREIGLRKALGATEKNIMAQFLLEAVILTAVGGVVGIIFGAVLSWLTAFAMQALVSTQWAFIFPISAAVIGLAVSAFVGLIFGIYPASQAAKKDPIEALRYE